MIKSPDLSIDLEQIPLMSFAELKVYYNYLFKVSTNSTRKQFYVWRVTLRLQELRFGGLDDKTRKTLETMEEPKIQDKSLPLGTELITKYKGATYRLRIVTGGFELEGEFYKSLAAVAYKITGRKISGQEFFGV